MKIKLKPNARLFPGTRFKNIDIKKWKQLRVGEDVEVSISDFESGEQTIFLSASTDRGQGEEQAKSQGWTVLRYEENTHSFVAKRNEWDLVKHLFDEIKERPRKAGETT